jgi:V/A-type H+-transporting ATPase subunit I
MIVKMSKVEIVGAKDQLQQALTLVRDMGIFHVEPATIGFVEKELSGNVRSYALDEATARERAYLEEIAAKIDDLFICLPKVRGRTTYVEPASIITTVARTIDRHTASMKETCEQRDGLLKEKEELERQTIFLGTLASLLESAQEAPDLDFIGLTIREPGMVGRLQEAISRITNWKYELNTETARTGPGASSPLKGTRPAASGRPDRRASRTGLPEAFATLRSATRSPTCGSGSTRSPRGRARDRGHERFSLRWGPLYRTVRDWIDDRLSLLRTTAAAFETRMCFFINGWMPSRHLARLREQLVARFGSTVVVDEKGILEEDLERVPIVLQNPQYFRPFELFTRLLPLPAYTSYDPTPFIGIFFPVFFGMILGDAGYGLFLGVAALLLLRRHRRGIVADGARILVVSSFYSVVFGVLYGEFFGDLPHALFGLEPLWLERRTAIIPMIFFALAVGVSHVLLGLVLGAISSFRKKRKEALYKLMSVAIIIGLVVVAASASGIFPQRLARPVVIAILVLTPFLFLTGGLLAPIEFLKNIGNIISYVRVMAIGLTSVLLAHVANSLAGLTGNVLTGILVAGLLHALNIVLGVFSPTIHALRLHYVEFFSKFIEHGGRRYEPLTKSK